jgi:hypothetical protein
MLNWLDRRTFENKLKRARNIPHPPILFESLKKFKTFNSRSIINVYGKSFSHYKETCLHKQISFKICNLEIKANYLDCRRRS